MPPMKHPCRCAIVGTMQIKSALQEIVGRRGDIHPGLKQFLNDEIAAKTTPAAEIHLHVVDHANGDSSGSWHVKAVKMG